MERYTVADLLRQSSLIFVGDVIDIQFCQAQDSTIPFTFVTFSRLAIIHGSYEFPELTLAFAGGAMNGEFSDFEDIPKFNRKERLLLFLTARPRYRLTPTVGWSQGVLRVEADGLKTYAGLPILEIDEKSFEMRLATDIEPSLGAMDPAYGVQKAIASGKSERRSGPPGRETVPAPVTETPMSEESFREGLRSLLRALQIPAPEKGRLLAPGFRFALPPVRVRAAAERRVLGQPTASSAAPDRPEPQTSETFPASHFDPRSDGAPGFYYVECSGDVMKWNNNRARMKRHPSNMPDGSDAARAILASERRWNQVRGDTFTYIDASDNDDVVVIGGDGNEISLMYSDFLDGALAKTYLRYDWCGPLDDLWPGHNMLIKEADILFK